MPRPSEVRAGASPFKSEKFVKPNHRLINIANIRQSHSKEDLIKYNEILTKEGWKVNPTGEYCETNDSGLGKGSPYYVSRSNSLYNITDPERKHTSTWYKSNALLRSNIIDIDSDLAAADSDPAPATRRNSRKRRTTRRRRASRKHHRTYRK